MQTPLIIEGEIPSPTELTVEEINSWPSDALIQPVSDLIPGRAGDALKLSALLQRMKPSSDATHITFHASVDGFAASIPLELISETGLLIYQQEGQPLSHKQGGPFRFLIPDAAPCKTAELDACANVKFVDRIELTVGKGKDTRNMNSQPSS